MFNDRQSNAQAFSVVVQSHQSPQLIEALKAVTQTSRAFASSNMRRKNPEAYQGAIRSLGRSACCCYQLATWELMQCTPEYYLSNRIKAIAGVIDVVVPNKNVDKNGLYILLYSEYVLLYK